MSISKRTGRAPPNSSRKGLTATSHRRVDSEFALALRGPGVRQPRLWRNGNPSAAGAKTMAVDPKTGTIYLPTADLEPTPNAKGRRSPLPGTFKVVVVSEEREH